MPTFLFDKIIFGPVNSRRLGLSLGINLLTPSSKHCNFDCIYCECGWNAEHPAGHFNMAISVTTRLEKKLAEMAKQGRLPDYITFAGNGEPTMHPEFETIIDQTIAIRDTLAPKTKIAVLSNATMIDRVAVRQALMKVDRNILKLDSAIESTQKLINQPNNFRPIEQQIELLKKFDGKLVIQTMFLAGEYNNQKFDNTTPDEIQAWIEALEKIKPREVMIYSIDRDTPAGNLRKIDKPTLEKIAAQVQSLGIEAIVS